MIIPDSLRARESLCSMLAAGFWRARLCRLLCFCAALLLCNGAFGATYFSIETLAGTGTAGFSGDGGMATLAQLNFPSSVSVDASGNIYLADVFNSRIRQITPSGVISTIAGNGTAGFSGDGGNAAAAQLKYPTSAVKDASGNLYIADSDNHRVRKVSPAGIITTIAGTGTGGFGGDGGPATLAQLNYPSEIAVDRVGNIYIADQSNYRIRKVSLDGTILTVAVLSAAPGRGPYGMALNSSGDLYIADGAKNQILKLPAGGGLIVVAGTGSEGYGGDEGPATSAELDYPRAISLDSLGNLYIADAYNHRIRMVSAAGVISTVAGTGTPGFNGDGAPAIGTGLNTPFGVWADGAGRVYVADSGNNRVRRLVPITPPSLSVSPSVLSFTPQTGRQSVSVGSSSLLSFAATASTSSGGSWLTVATPNPISPGTVGVAAPSTLYVYANPAGLLAGTYQGAVTISSSSASNSPQTVAVTLRHRK